MYRRRFLLLASLLVILTTVVAACGGGAGGAGAGAQTVSIEGSEFSYNPNTVTAKAGQKVSVNFKNVGTVQHTFVIKDLNFKLVADPGQTVTGSFTAPSKAGTYEIHCDTAGHTEAGMKGSLVVQ